MGTATLEDYLRVEREEQVRGARTGLLVHAAITAVVCVVLVVVNLTVADEFPWSAFVVAGMLIGLGAHWWGGYRDVTETVARHQDDLLRRAASGS